MNSDSKQGDVPFRRFRSVAPAAPKAEAAKTPSLNEVDIPSKRFQSIPPPGMPRFSVTRERCARMVIVEACFEGVADVHTRGYRWARDYFVASHRWLQSKASWKHMKVDHELLSSGYRMLGDLHDLNDAPAAAADAYESAIALDEGSSYAWRELGLMRLRMGEREPAITALETACRLNPDDEEAEDYLQSIFREGVHAIYEEGDLIWDVDEALAAIRPKEALKLLKGKRGVDVRLARARAFGALGRNKDVLSEWKAIVRTTSEVLVTYRDWYFTPRELLDDPRLWSALSAIGDRLVGLVPAPHVVNDLYSESEQIAPAVQFHLQRTLAL